MGSRLLLAALLLLPLGASAIEEEDPPLLEAVLLEFVAPEKVKTLGPTPTLEAIISAIEPKRHPEARAGLREFQSSDPDVLKKKQRAAILLEDPQNLLATSRELGGLAPEDPEALIGEAHALALSGDFESANAAATKALELAPNDRRAQDLAWYTRRMRAAPPEDAKPTAELKTTSGGLSEAAQQAGRRVLFRKQAVEHSREAMRRYNVGDYDDTLRFSKLAIAADPTLPDPYMQQGLALMEKREYAKAEDRFRIASTLWRLNGSEKAKLAETGLAQAQAGMEGTPAASQGEGSSKGVPAGVPLTAAGLVFLAGAWWWKRSGREWAELKAREIVATGVMAVGAAFFVGGAWMAAGAVGTGAGPAFVGGGAAGEAIGVSGVAAINGAIASGTGVKLLQDGYSYSKSGASDESLNPTKHGSERIADGNQTRGGALSVDEIHALKASGAKTPQEAGGHAFYREVEPGKFNVYIESADQRMITSFRHIRPKKLQNLARNYGWRDRPLIP